MKSLLCILSQSPYAGSHATELLDAAMVAAVFDFRVSVLLRGDAVWILQPGQDAGPLGVKTPGRVITALPSYDVSDIYVCMESAASRGIIPSNTTSNTTSGITRSETSDTTVPVTALDLLSQAELIRSHDIVMSGAA